MLTEPIFISIIALIVSIWSLYIQRQHNRKSVRPAGHIQLNDSVNGLYIKIVNKGCGPMYIKSLLVEGSNKKIEKNIYYHLPQLKITSFSYEYHTEPTGYWLTPGESLTLLNLFGDIKNKEFTDFKLNVRNILKDLKVTMVYTDVYDKEHPKYVKELGWFGRDL